MQVIPFPTRIYTDAPSAPGCRALVIPLPARRPEPPKPEPASPVWPDDDDVEFWRDARKTAAREPAAVALFPAAAMPPADAAKKESRRKAMLGKIHLGLERLYAKLPGFTEDTYRYFMRERWGVDTAAKLDIKQLDEILHWMAELGFQGNHPHYGRRDYQRMGTYALAQKINALLAEKRAQEGKPFIGLGYAEGILRNMTKGEVTDLRLATPKQLRGVVAALTGDARRKGRRTR
jgi:hypothetical protein